MLDYIVQLPRLYFGFETLDLGQNNVRMINHGVGHVQNALLLQGYLRHRYAASNVAKRDSLAKARIIDHRLSTVQIQGALHPDRLIGRVHLLLLAERHRYTFLRLRRRVRVLFKRASGGHGCKLHRLVARHEGAGRHRKLELVVATWFAFMFALRFEL